MSRTIAIGSLQDFQQLALHELAQIPTAGCTCLHGANDPIDDRHADVGADQRLLQRVECVDGDRSRSFRSRTGWLTVRAPGPGLFETSSAAPPKRPRNCSFVRARPERSLSKKLILPAAA